MDSQLLLSSDVWVSLLTLTGMEIILGIDNIVFISILTSKLPAAQQPRARNIGLALALITRLGLLFTISWVMGLTRPLFTVLDRGVSGRDLILLLGGLFLMGKATHEIHDKLEVQHDEEAPRPSTHAFGVILVQIMLLDIVFSLDSVITAVGMASHIPVMVAAMVISVVVMLIFAAPVSDFVNRHPSMKILALSFLLLIGFTLTLEGMGKHVEKGYIYSAMAFSLMVELINMRVRKAAQRPVELHGRFEKERTA
ncbi:MAG: TerC family protein [Myxococcota bacterium]